MTDSGTNTGSPLSGTQDAWVGRVLAALGLSRSAAPVGTPVREIEAAFLARLDTAVWGRMSAIIAADEDTLDILKDRIARETDPAAKARLLQDAGEVETRAARMREDLAARKTAGARLAQVTAVRKDQQGRVDDLAGAVQAGYETLAETHGDLTRAALMAEARRGVDAGTLDWYDGYRRRLADRIDAALAETFTVSKHVLPNGTYSAVPIRQTFTAIGTGEYAILTALLAKADLALVTEGAAAARVIVDEADAALLAYRNARTGEERPDVEPLTGTELDPELTAIHDAVALLMANGYREAAAEFDLALAQLVGYAASQPAGADLSGFAAAAEEWAEKAGAAATVVGRIDTALTRATERLRVFRANDDPDREREAETLVRGFDRTGTMAACLDRAEAMLAEVVRLADACLDDATPPSLDIATMTSEKAILAARFEAIEDDTSIPEETRTELALRLASFDTLIGSGSVEARALAGEALGDLQDALDHMEDAGRTHRQIEARLKAAASQLAKNERAYTLHLVPERAEFRTRLAAIEGDATSVFQGRVLVRLTDWEEDFAAFQGACHAQKAAVDALAKRADALGARFPALATAIGLYLRSQGRDDGLTGYHGAMEGELRAVRAHLARPTESAVTTATQALGRLEPRMDALLDLLDRQTRANGQSTSWWTAIRDTVAGGPAVISSGELALIDAATADALRGDADHARMLEEKAAFKEAAVPVPAAIRAAMREAAELRVDDTALGVIEAEFRVLLSEADARQDYATALRLLEGLKTRLGTARAGLLAEKAEKDASVAETTDAAIAALRLFRDRAGGFYDAEIAPKLDGAAVDEGALRKFFDLVRAAVPDAEAGTLEAAARTLSGDGPRDAKLGARKTALRIVRALMAGTDGAAVGHYRAQPFDPGDASAGDLAARLARLEVKVLTALGKG